MFSPGSRYQNSTTYGLALSDGRSVLVTRLPLPSRPPLRGFHRRLEGQRLDLIANHYLGDPTAAFRLCDANGTIAPDVLAARELIAIPAKAR